MSTDSKAQWLKLTVVQLKGALTMRGLDVDGKKPELVERLSQFEANKEKMKEEAEKKAAEEQEKGANGDVKMETDDTEAKKETEKEEDPYSMTRGKFCGSYRSAAALLTVLITPFNDEFFSTATFNEHVKKTKTFKIHKIWNAISAAELRFSTVSDSEEAFIAMKNELASMDVDVYHPGFRTNFNQVTMRNEEFQNIFKGMEDDDTSFDRMILMDKLPEGTTDCKLAELIPEAVELVDIGYYDESPGCYIVVFNSKHSCMGWMEKHGAEFKIDEHTVRCHQYYKKERIGNFVRNKQVRTKKLKGDKPEANTEKLSNEDRLAKVKEWNDLLNGRNVIQDRDDILAYEKLRQEKKITEDMTTLSKELLNDAKLKLNAKEKLPEPEDQMTAPVKRLAQMGEEVDRPKPKPKTDAQRTPNRGENQRGKGASNRGGTQRGSASQRGGGAQRGGASQRGGGAVRGSGSQRGGGAQRGNYRGSNQRGRVGGVGAMNRRDGANTLRKRPNTGPIRQPGRVGSYYDDAPSKKKPRQLSPYRGSSSMNMGGGGSYNQQGQQLQGLTSMLSSKMRELERMQQQTLAVQSQLSQNMRISDYGRSDSYSNTAASVLSSPTQNYSSMSGYTGPSQTGYSGSSSSAYGTTPSYGSSSQLNSAYSNLASTGSAYGSGGGGSSNYVSNTSSVQSLYGGYTGGSSQVSHSQSYGGGSRSGGGGYSGGSQRRNTSSGGGQRNNRNRRR